MAHTFVIIKPDAVERGLVGTLISRFETKGFVIAALELTRISEDLARKHYAEHKGKHFFEDLITFITRSPSVIMTLEGPEDSVEIVRRMLGETNPACAQPGTMRGDFGIHFTENLVHGSDSLESAKREIDLFFPGLKQM